MKTSLILSLFLIFSLTIACDRDGVSQKEIRNLEEAKEKWEAKKSPDYTFKYNRGCFCPYFGNLEVRVNADTISALIDLETSLEATIEIDGEMVRLFDFYPNSFYTIDALFEELEIAVNSADEMSGKYDSDLGYPLEVFIDYHTEAIDDEVSYTLSDMELLTAPVFKD